LPESIQWPRCLFDAVFSADPEASAPARVILVLYLIRVSVQLEVPVGGTKCAHEGDALGPFVNRSLKDFVVRPIVLVSKPFMHPLSAGASDCAVLFLKN
jgi:hypothetical protein